MPFLLMVFLVLVCLPEPDAWPNPLWTDSPQLCIAATWMTILLGSLHAFWLARGISAGLQKDPSQREHLLARYELGRLRQQIALFVLYVLAVLGLGWGWAVSQVWRGAATPLPCAELLILSPFVVGQLLAWTAYYDAERAAHRAAHRLLATKPQVGVWVFHENSEFGREGAPKSDSVTTSLPNLPDPENVLARSGLFSELERPSSTLPPPFGSRAGYVLFQLRQKLALVFLPVFLLLVQKELQRLFPEEWQNWQKAVNFLGIAFVLVVFATMPWIVRLVLGLKPLADGPMRRRLEAAARRLRFRCSNILVWNTRNGMANAMVIGILPWVRYIVFTDRLLEDFTPDEIEAVFGHEVGHIRHHHMLYYFGFLTASVIVIGWMINDLVVFYKGPDPFGLSNHSSDWVSVVSLVAVLLAYIFVVFGFLSRRCERQADVFGCRAVSCSSPECRGHKDEYDDVGRGQGLCPTGINTFIRALEKVAAVNGISRDRPGFLQSWQHASIGRRIEFLQRVLLDPGVERRFQRRVFLFKSLLLLVLGGTVAFIFAHDTTSAPVVEQRKARLAPNERR
jgi:Zn-dependent protease with chaperone function